MRYPGLFGEHAGTMVVVMQQAGLYRAAHCATDCVEMCASAEIFKVRHLISCRVAGKAVMCFSPPRMVDVK